MIVLMIRDDGKPYRVWRGIDHHGEIEDALRHNGAHWRDDLVLALTVPDAARVDHAAVAATLRALAGDADAARVTAQVARVLAETDRVRRDGLMCHGCARVLAVDVFAHDRRCTSRHGWGFYCTACRGVRRRAATGER